MKLADITLRTQLQAGDIGTITAMHGRIYAQERAHGIAFECYVAEGLVAFWRGYQPTKDGLWLATHQGKLVGSIFLQSDGATTAQLRYFLIDPAYRGLGLGSHLMQQFMDALPQRGYTRAFLWTTQELDTAAHIYTKFGFRLAENLPSTRFGKTLTEQKYVYEDRP